MKKITTLILIILSMDFLMASGITDTPEGADSTSIRNGAINVFFEGRLDMNYTREQIPYVNYVREVREADIYILETRQDVGGGGSQYTYSFQGLGEFEGMNDTLVYTSNPDLTSSTIREKRTNLLKMGLMRYVAKTPYSNVVEIKPVKNFEAVEVFDRWDNWVFELRTSPRFNAEETYKSLNFFNSVSISKITPDIKLDINLFQSYNRQKFINDNENTIYISRGESVGLLFVKSLGEHWSAGIRWNLSGSTQSNYDLKHQFMPAIEYDLYPYSESTHKQLRILYSTGYEYSNYIDTTILNLVSEHRFKQDLSLAYQVQEKWGSINLALKGSTYFYDFTKNSVELNGFVQIRIIKGLSFSINGEAGYINNRLSQRKGIVTEAERLLRLKQQATNFVIGGSLSINYTFGSIYNNVVNPRFGR